MYLWQVYSISWASCIKKELKKEAFSADYTFELALSSKRLYKKGPGHDIKRPTTRGASTMR